MPRTFATLVLAFGLTTGTAVSAEDAPPAKLAPAAAAEPAPAKPAPAKPAPAKPAPAKPVPAEPEGDKLLSGMSIVGNDEAPKSLVIVPWKSAALGHAIDLSKILDDGRQPVDKDVFLRELSYYQIRAAAE